MLKSYRLTTLILTIAIGILIIVSTMFVIMTYVSTQEAIDREISRSFEFRHQIAELRIEEILENASKDLLAIADEYTSSAESNFLNLERKLESYILNANGNYLDILMLVKTNQATVKDLSSPFIQNSELLYEQYMKKNQLSGSWQLVIYENQKSKHAAFFNKTPIINAEYGQVDAYIIYGFSLENNIPIINSIRNNAEVDALQFLINDHVLTSSAIEKSLNNQSTYLSRTTATRFNSDNQHLNIRSFMKNTATQEVNTAYKNNLLILIVSSLFAVLVMLLLIRRITTTGFSSLMNYAQSVRQGIEQPPTAPGYILEFNTLSSSLEEMMTSIRVSKKALQESEVRFRRLFETAEVSIWNEDLSEVISFLDKLRLEGVTDLREFLDEHPQSAWDLVSKVHVSHVNQATLKLFCAKEEDDFLFNIEKTFGDNAIDVFCDELCAIWRGDPTFKREANFITLAGDSIVCIISFQIPEQKDDYSTIPVSLINITERKYAENELRKLSLAVESSSSAVIITDLDGNIEYVNPHFTESTGYTKEEIIGKNTSILNSAETPEYILENLWKTIRSGKDWKGEIRNQKKDGSLYWAHYSISGVKNENGVITHYIAIEDDITKEYELTEQLSFQASHDILTGLINRREFESRAERVLSTIYHEKSEHALCFMDLDQFKVINDTCGHVAGDELLRQLGDLLQSTVRKRDTLARLGGDEFGVLIEHCSLEQAQRIAETIQEAVKNFHFIWDGQHFHIGISIGLVSINPSVQNLTELLSQADAACYMAKDLGRNRIQVYYPDDAELVLRHGEVQWVARINNALEENKLCLYAQPIIQLNSSIGVKQHYELLLRMEDDEGGIILPGAFLPAAERYNLTEIIDAWVVKNAFRLLSTNKQFVDKLHFLSINLSGPSLTNEGFLDYIISQLKKFDIAPNKICFEITETVAISNLAVAIDFISILKRLGCYFALDDFGSGLSSYGYLKNLPVDYLKIDGMFVKGIASNPIDYAMVKSINEIGHIMGMQTIAEFVENDKIRTLLLEINVNYGQGYSLGKPQPFTDLLKMRQ